MPILNRFGQEIKPKAPDTGLYNVSLVVTFVFVVLSIFLGWYMQKYTHICAPWRTIMPIPAEIPWHDPAPLRRV